MLTLRCLALVALLIVLEGCSGPAAPGVFVATVPPAAVSAEYRLVSGDLLDITVFQVPDLTKEVQIDNTGQISLPLIGDVKAAGETAHALEAEIAVKLRAKYLQSPEVSVFVKNAAGQQVTVIGSVNKPGVYPMVGQMTLIQALAQSGDLTDVGDPSAVRVFRQAGGSRTAGVFNIDDIRAGKAQDPNLYAGDTVIVDASNVRTAWKNTQTILTPFVSGAEIAATVAR